MKKERIQWFFIILFFFALFLGSYLYRRYISDDIKLHSQFAIGKIFKQTGSLKSGNAWHYQFLYHGKLYEGYRSTHVDYDVNLGDYFLVNFSSTDPNHSKMLYDYKLNNDKLNYVDSVWDEIPNSILHSAKK